MDSIDKCALAQKWLDRRFFGLTPRHFGNGVFLYGYEGLKPPAPFVDVWLPFNGTDPPAIPQAIAEFGAVVIFGNHQEEGHFGGICRISAALSVCNDAPPVFWALHTAAPEDGPPDTRVPSEALMEVMGHGLDEMLDCENVGLELVAAIRTRIQKSEALARILNSHIEQRRNDARQAEFMESVIHDTLWCDLCERLAPAIPPIDPDLPPGVVWTLPGFNFGRWLGNGSFCTVYKLLPLQGDDQDTQEVIKVVDKSLVKEPEDIKQLGCMIDIMLKLNQLGSRHPNITELRGIYHSPTHLFFRESYGGPQNLFGRLTQRQQLGPKQRPLSIAHTISIITQFCSAVLHIHTVLHICHRDIKPENILIDDTAQDIYLKLTDFDLAVIQRDRALCKKTCGTMPFIAPEVLSQAKYDGLAADIWSVGIVVFEICCGIKVLEKILASQRSDFKLSNTKTVSSRKSMSDFIKACFSKPSFAVTILDEQCLDDVRPILPVTKPLFHGMCTVSVEQRLTASQTGPAMAQLEEMRLAF